MPKYSWNIDDLLFEEDVKLIYNRCQTKRDAVLVAFLWIAGPRPEELREVKRESIAWNDEALMITFPTKKKGKKGKFKLTTRTLRFERKRGFETSLYIETIIQYVEGVLPGNQILPYTTRWQEKRINVLTEKAIGKRMSPYHFRHSALSWLAAGGATIEELMHFKGASSVLSVSPYLHAKPFIVKLQNQRRSRAMDATDAGKITEVIRECCPHNKESHYQDGGCLVCGCNQKGTLKRPDPQETKEANPPNASSPRESN
jgi:site-specific recombinase XerD